MTSASNGDRTSAANPAINEPIVRLQFAGDRIALEVTASGGTAPTTLDVGSLQRISAILVHEPATAQEIEAAIAEIEDMLTPAIRKLPKPATLMASVALFRTLPQILGRPEVNPAQLEVSTVEEVFGRLASVAYGTPATQMGIPESRSFAAAVLVLRELMHHAGFPSVGLM